MQGSPSEEDAGSLPPAFAKGKAQHWPWLGSWGPLELVLPCSSSWVSVPTLELAALVTSGLFFRC